MANRISTVPFQLPTRRRNETNVNRRRNHIDSQASGRNMMNEQTQTELACAAKGEESPGLLRGVLFAFAFEFLIAYLVWIAWVAVMA